MVAVVPEVHLVEVVELEDPLPLVLGEVGGAVHGAQITRQLRVWVRAKLK